MTGLDAFDGYLPKMIRSSWFRQHGFVTGKVRKCSTPKCEKREIEIVWPGRADEWLCEGTLTINTKGEFEIGAAR